MKNKDAADMLTSALESGATLTVECNNGDTVTVGNHPDLNSWFGALRWGRSQWARPSGLVVVEDPHANPVAWEVVRHCGRGNVARAVRALLNRENLV